MRQFLMKDKNISKYNKILLHYKDRRDKITSHGEVENMKPINVTFDTFQLDKSNSKIVALEPALENILAIVVTLEVSQLDRFPILKVVVL